MKQKSKKVECVCVGEIYSRDCPMHYDQARMLDNVSPIHSKKCCDASIFPGDLHTIDCPIHGEKEECRRCSKEFKPKHANKGQIYCSALCRNRDGLQRFKMKCECYYPHYNCLQLNCKCKLHKPKASEKEEMEKIREDLLEEHKGAWSELAGTPKASSPKESDIEITETHEKEDWYFFIDEPWVKYYKKWVKQGGRTEEMCHGVGNFMTGQGAVMLKDLLAEQKKDFLKTLKKVL